MTIMTSSTSYCQYFLSSVVYNVDEKLVVNILLQLPVVATVHLQPVHCDKVDKDKVNLTTTGTMSRGLQEMREESYSLTLEIKLPPPEDGLALLPPHPPLPLHPPPPLVCLLPPAAQHLSLALAVTRLRVTLTCPVKMERAA